MNYVPPTFWMLCAFWYDQLISEDVLEVKKAYEKDDKADQDFCIRRD